MPFYNISSDCYPYYACSTRICETTYDDGFLHNEQGHPRAAGTFPRLIDKYVKTGKLSLYDAINKMTTMQAKKLGRKTMQLLIIQLKSLMELNMF